MRRLTGPSRTAAGQGFTLIELLLVVVLVMLLTGAVVFNFSSLTDHAVIEEAATRMETLFRFARAQAANTGCRVRVVFAEGADTNAAMPSLTLQLEWEPRPLDEPGVFLALPETALEADTLLSRIQIESVELGEELSEPDFTSETLSSDEELLLDELLDESLPSITFQPDGSSDSARVVIASTEGDELRRMKLSLNGITGALSRQSLPGEGDESFADDFEALAAEMSGATEAARPTGAEPAGSGQSRTP